MIAGTASVSTIAETVGKSEAKQGVIGARKWTPGMYTYMCIYVFACVFMHTYIHTHAKVTYTYTHKHRYTHIPNWWAYRLFFSFSVTNLAAMLILGTVSIYSCLIISLERFLGVELHGYI